MNESILVVDDEPLILLTIERALVKKGYDVRIASDAESFLRELEREGADLLIMDMTLGNVSSVEIMERVRALAPDAKVLFISGVRPEQELEHFLEKPFMIDELREKVRLVLDGK